MGAQPWPDQKALQADETGFVFRSQLLHNLLIPFHHLAEDIIGVRLDQERLDENEASFTLADTGRLGRIQFSIVR